MNPESNQSVNERIAAVAHSHLIATILGRPMAQEQAKLLADTIVDILAHADNFRMVFWFNAPVEVEDQFGDGTVIRTRGCGTTCCIAGSIVLRAGGVRYTQRGYTAANGRNIGEVAAELIRLSPREAGALFHASSWRHIDERFSDIEATAQNAAMVITEFLRLKGYDAQGEPITA